VACGYIFPHNLKQINLKNTTSSSAMETALQGGLVLAKSRRRHSADNIVYF